MKFIYLTTNLINGKKYIGQHTTDKEEDGYLGSGILLTKAVNCYGKENFKRDILCYCETQEELDVMEKYYIEKYQAVENDDYYNLKEGGQEGDGWQALKRWRKANPEKAMEHDKRAAQNLKKWAEENPEKVQENIKIWIEAGHQYYRDNPEKLKEHIKLLNQKKEEWQKQNPEQHKKQVDEWRRKGSETNSKKVKCLTTNEIFSSISEAGRTYNIPQPNISKALTGERKSAGKHPITKEKMFWSWVTEE